MKSSVNNGNSRIVGYSEVGPKRASEKLLPRFPDCACPVSSAPSSRTLGATVVGWLEAGWLFEDIQKSSCAIDSVTLRIAYPLYDTRTF